MKASAGFVIFLLLFLLLASGASAAPALIITAQDATVDKEILIDAVGSDDWSGYGIDITTPTATLKYLPPNGALEFPLSFYPSEPGEHTIELFTKSPKEIVATSSFTVAPNGGVRSEPRITRSFHLADSKGEQVEGRISLYRGRRKVYENHGLASSFQEGKYDVELQPQLKNFVSVRLENTTLNDTLELGLERLGKRFVINEKESTDAFAIDPTQLNFDSGLVTRVATGTELWKCKDWIFATQTCTGSWVKLMDLVPGQEYSFVISTLDPGFVETGQSDFDNGTYYRTYYNASGGFVQLNLTYSSGNFTSQIFNATDNATWDNISWTSNALGPLEDNQQGETQFARDNINMSENLLLYHMDEITTGGAPGGSDVEDTSGNSHHANESGSVTMAGGGRFSTGLGFDESDDYINATDFSYGPSFTLAFWFNPTDNAGSQWQYLYSHGTYSTTNSLNIALAEDSNFLDVIRTSLYDSSNQPGQSVLDLSNVSRVADGNWHHYALTVESSNITVYIDGVANTSTSTGGGSFNPATNVIIGGREDTDSQRFYGGDLDELAIWNRTLSTDEILSLYTRGATLLNLSVRSCNDGSCSGESWTEIPDVSPQNLSLDNNTYFQYLFVFDTNNQNYTPELYNVTVMYHLDLNYSEFNSTSPSTGVASADNVTSFGDGYTGIDGDYTDTFTNNQVYWGVYRDNTGGSDDNLTAYMNLTYNVSATGANPADFTKFVFNVTYCHADEGTTPLECQKNLKSGVHVQNVSVELYNYSSSSFVAIGTLNVSEAVETTNNYTVTSGLADFVSNDLITIRFPVNVTFSATNRDVAFMIDWALLTVTWSGTPCQTISTPGFYNLSGNLTATGTCFNIETENVTIDCKGHTINYSSAGTLGYAVNNTGGYDNVTVKNCVIVEGTATTNSKHGIYYDSNADNGTILNNTITTIGTSSTAIRYDSSIGVTIVNNTMTTSGDNGYGVSVFTTTGPNTVTGNNITTTGTNSGYGMWISNANNTAITDNTINTTGTGTGYGILLSTSADNNTITNNQITTSSNSARAIYLLSSSSSNTIRKNTITTTGSTACYGIQLSVADNNLIDNNTITTNACSAIFMDSASYFNILLNNNLSASSASEVDDSTGNTYINYLVYNNSYGQIRWVNETNNGFLKDMDVDGDIALGTNLFIGNNTAALNTSAFGAGRINSSANITFYNLDFISVTNVKRHENYTTSEAEILANGTNCQGTFCDLLLYAGGTLKFNVSGFSSFAGVDGGAPDTTPPASVTGLANQSAGIDWIYWNWTNPGDADFNSSIIYINGSWYANVTVNYYNATGLTPDTGYVITVHTKDHTGNVNDTDVNDSARTLVSSDTTPPGTVTGLANQSKSYTWIYWNWTNPGDGDFFQSIIYLNGTWQENTSNNFYNATGLSLDTTYTLTVHTKDTSNNVNDTDVNDTGRTLADTTNPTIAYATPTPDDDTNQSATSFVVNVTHSDLFPDTIRLYVNGVINQSQSYTGAYTNFSLSSVAEGTYTYYVWVNDTTNNTNQTATRTIRIDHTVPRVTLLSPANRTNHTTNNITFTYNVTDAWLDIPNCSLIIDGSINVTNTTITENTTISITANNLGEGTHTWSINCTDGAGNRNGTASRTLTIDTQGPNITLVFPHNKSGDGNGEVAFRFNVTDTTSDVTNCSLLFDGSVNTTVTSIVEGNTTSILHYDLLPQRYNWSIRCTDEHDNVETSPERFVDVILMTGFVGATTTNLSEVDTSAIENFTIDHPTLGRIIHYNEDINLSGGANLDSIITIQYNHIEIDTVAEPRLNKSASLWLFNLPYKYNPVLLRNNIICSGGICTFGSYANTNLTFNVTGFTSYASTDNSELTLWDDTDPEEGSQEKYEFDNVNFYANYSNRTSGDPITSVVCNISFDTNGWTNPVSMTYNATSKLHEYNRSFNVSGMLDWNVTCYGNSQGYENLTVLDTVAIRPLDYFVQRDYATIPTGQTSVTITAGSDYTAPSSTSNAFIRIVSTRLTGSGHDSGGGTQDPNEYMVSIENPENLLTSITFRRYSSTGSFNSRVYWEIIEYTGPPGGANEMQVRAQDEISHTGSTSMSGSSASGVVNDSDIVVFITGQRHNGAGSSDGDRGMFIANWTDGTDTPNFRRGDGTGTSALSYAVVEFTGYRWEVQRVNHTYTGTGVQSESITAVSDESKTFIHTQGLTTSGNLDELGQEVWLSANDTVSFYLRLGGVFSREGAAWIIENTQAVGTSLDLNTQRFSATRASGGGEPDEWFTSITQVQRLVTTSIMGESATSSGGGSSGPRGPFGLMVNTVDNVSLWRTDTGQNQYYRFEVVEWPSGPYNFPPSKPTDIECNGTTNCNLEVDEGVDLEGLGSEDYESDTITYYLEVSLGNETTSSDQESGEQQVVAQAGTTDVIFADDFNTDSGEWTYTGSCTRITGDTFCRDGNACIRCTGTSSAGEDGTAISTQDLSSYDYCIADFYYRARSLDNGAECGYHRYFDTLYHDILQICDPADDNAWHAANYNYTALGYSLEEESEVKYSLEASGGADYWYIDNSNLTCYNYQWIQTSSSWTTYADVASGSFADMNNITVTINVSVYDSSGSDAAGNQDPDLEVALYNGTAYESIGTLSATGTGNASVTTTDAGILAAWQTAANRDMRVRAVNMDYYNSTDIDEIRWNAVWTNLNGQAWQSIGSHTAGNSLYWNTSQLPEQECVDVRARAIDLAGSNLYSDYYEENGCINITHPTRITGKALNVTVINQTHRVMLKANVTDNQLVASVNVTLQYPNSTRVNLSLTQGPGQSWHLNFSDTNQTGVYSFTDFYTVDGEGNTANFTSSLTFTVTASPPGAFTLLTPANNTESNNLIPTMNWTQSSDEHFDNYTLLFDKDPNFGSPDYSYNTFQVDNTSYTLDFGLDANSVYYWRVIAYDVFGSRTNSTIDLIYITDTIPPNVSMEKPDDGFSTNNPAVVFNFSMIETNTVANCTLYHNATGSFGPNVTNSSITKGQTNHITVTFPDAEFSWGVICHDLAGNVEINFTNNNRTVIVDLIPPTIQLIAPPNNTYENTTNNVDFTVNTSDIRGNVSSCVLIIDDVVEQTETDITDGVPFNFTDFVLNGQHNWSVNCTDTNGNTYATDRYNLTVNVTDEDPPFITLNYPENDAFVDSSTILFNYTVEDATGVENCSLYIDGVLNQTNTSINNFVANYFTVTGLAETGHNWTVECYDNSTELNLGTTSTYNFTVDLTDPTVSLNAPPDNEFVQGSTIPFNYTPTDLNLHTCVLYGNFTGSWSDDILNTSLTSGQPNTLTKTVSDGTYLWNVYCNDSAGRSTFAVANWTVKVDTTPPQYDNITVVPASPATYSPSAVYQFNITWTDNFALDVVNFENNFSGTLQNESLSDAGASVYNYSIIGLDAGTYVYKWYANDTNDNKNETTQYSYVVNKAASEVNLVLNSTDDNFTIDEDSTANMTVTMVTPTSGFVELYLDSVLIQNGTAPITNITLFSQPGLYNVTAVYPATANYLASTETHWLTVDDTTSPNITLIYPDADASVGSNDVTLQFNVSDNVNISNCSIYINDTLNQTNTSVDQSQTQFFDVYFPDGNYSWEIRCYDTGGNLAQSESRNFTVLQTDTITVSVGVNPASVERGTSGDITTNTTDVFGANLDTNVTTDIIKGNATAPWWNTGWALRKPIMLSQDAGTQRSEIVTVNVSGINLSSCANELRIVRHQDGVLTNLPRTILDGDDSTWCQVKFVAVIGASASNETLHHAYYNNSGAFNPGDGLGTGGFRVQHGTIASQTGVTLTDNIITVDQSKSFILFTAATGTQSAPDQNQYTPGFSSDTVVRFDRYDGATASNLTYAVVESDALSVQRGTETFGSTEDHANVTITEVSLGNSFIIVNGRTISGTSSQNNFGFFRAYFLNSTTIRIERNTSGSSETTAAWQVVSWTGASVRNGTFSASGTTTNQDFASVDTSRSFVIWSRMMNGDDSLNTNSWRADLFNATRVVFTRQTSSPASVMGGSYFVVQLPDDFTAQNGLSSGGADRTVGISEVTENRSFFLGSWSNSGGGTSYANTLNRLYFSDNTTLGIDKSSTSQTSDIEWFVLNSEYNVSSAIGAEEEWIARNTSLTGGDGTWTWPWSTTGQELGDYTAVSLATKDAFQNGVGWFNFNITPDVTPPNVTLWLPVDFHEQGVGLVDFQYQVSDANLDECVLWFGKDGSWDANETDPAPVNDANNTFDDIYFGIGLWEWNVRCNDTEGNYGTASANFTLNVTGPDLVPTAIFFNYSDLIEGTNITIFANITNQGLSATEGDFTVQFFLGDPDVDGVQISGNITVGVLAINENVTVNVTYILQAGVNNIYVDLDRNQSINESDESNNKLNNTLTVELYQYFYGNVSSGVRLDNSNNDSFVIFGNQSNKDGHIFIADTDSSFDFTNLYALTRNELENPTANDFTDADENMNTTPYNDNVKQVWGGGTDTPLQTQNFSLSIGNITYVPIVNSSNSSKFVTGILWDSGDDSSSNDQYDTTDKEDLVFITRVNASMSGQWGLVDYEIRLPALLREYTGGTDQITIYTEVT